MLGPFARRILSGTRRRYMADGHLQADFAVRRNGFNLYSSGDAAGFSRPTAIRCRSRMPSRDAGAKSERSGV